MVTEQPSSSGSDFRTYGYSILLLIGFLLGTGLVAVLGSVVTETGLEWYAWLRTPPGTPPNSWFGPVWSVIYGFMAVSGWLVARRSHPERPLVLWLFLIQLVLNLSWNLVFFGGRSIPGGLILVVLLTAVLFGYIFLTHRVSRLASYLFFPYVIWVMYATYLNLGILILNT